MTTRVHLKIYGRVQGVCFRYYCVETAGKYGIKGFVRNNPDGGVEVVAEGAEEDLKCFAAWCRRGPPSARVLSCVENYEAPTEEFGAFTIEH